jgi:hypothetical protein
MLALNSLTNMESWKLHDRRSHAYVWVRTKRQASETETFLALSTFRATCVFASRSATTTRDVVSSLDLMGYQNSRGEYSLEHLLALARVYFPLYVDARLLPSDSNEFRASSWVPLRVWRRTSRY